MKERTNRHAEMIIGLLTVFFLTACSLTGYFLPPTPVGIDHKTRTPLATHTTAPSQVPSLPPTPVRPAQIGTAPVGGEDILTAQNVSQLSLLAQYGSGLGMDMAFTADGSLLVVAGTRGLNLYEGADLKLVRQVDTDTAQRTVAVSNDGKWLASGAEDGTIRLWKLPEVILQAVLKGHTQPVFSLAFSPDGQWLASGAWDRTLRIWYTPAADLVRTLDDPLSPVRAIQFSSDGGTLFAWHDKQPLRTWDLINDRYGDDIYIGVDNRGRTGSSAAFSADGSLFAVDQDSRVRLMHTEDGTTRAQLLDFRTPVLDVALSSDASLAATLQADEIKLWTTQPAELIRRFPLESLSGRVNKLIFDPNGGRLLALADRVYIWDINAEAEEPFVLDDAVYGSSYLNDAVYSENEDMILSLFLDNHLSTLDLSSGDMLKTDQLLTGTPDLMALSQNGGAATAAYRNGDVNVYDTADGAVLGALSGSGRALTQIAISADGRKVAVGSFAPSVRVWDASFTNQLLEIELDEPSASLSFSSNGELLAVKQDNDFEIYRVSNGQLLASLQGYALAFSPNGAQAALLATDNGDSVLRLVDITNGTELYSVPGVGNDLKFSPSGDLLVVSGH